MHRRILGEGFCFGEELGLLRFLSARDISLVC